MSSFNKVILMGNLTRDPEMRYTSGGTAVCTLGLAVNHKYSSNGEMKEEVCFVDITVWGKQAENCNQYLSKGRPVLVDGRLQLQSWESEGGKRSKHVVVADTVRFLSTGVRQQPQQSQRDNYSKAEGDVPF